MADISCPECKKIDPSKAIDRVEKVSAVAANGTPLGEELSLPLRPFLEPKREVLVPPVPTKAEEFTKPIGSCWKAFTTMSIGTTLVLSTVAAVIIYPLIALSETSAASLIIMVVIAAIVIGILLVYFVRRRETSFTQKTEEHGRAVQQAERVASDYELRKIRFEKARRQHDGAEEIWNQLYYCYRHDGVFLPDGLSPLIPRDQIRSFCRFP